MKKFIEEHCLTKTNNLNNRSCAELWWSIRNYHSEFKQINYLTSFLDEYSPSFAERLYVVVNGISNRKLCKSCGKFCNFNNYKNGYYTYCSTYCSTQCADRNIKIHTNRDYDKITEKMRATNLERYGVEYTTQSQNMIDKTFETKLDRYGDPNYNNQDKSKQTCLERYRVEFSAQDRGIINKIQYNKEILYPQLRDKDWLIKENSTKSVTTISEELGCTYRTVYLYFEKYNIEMNSFYSTHSKSQNEVFEYISSIYNGRILQNDRVAIGPKEIDIYLPDINLGIEYNGMYWHAEDSKRHLDKHDLCKNEGITLVQIWDHEWNTKKDIIKSIISSKIGNTERVFARKCSIIDVTSKDYKNFLNTNHLQGNVNSSIRKGLMYGGKLVCVMGLGKSRFDKKCSHELLRFANKLNITVIGGFDKLLNCVLTSYDIQSLQTFADMRLFNGSVYERSGFVFSHNSKPGYVYYKSNVIKTRQDFQKHKLSKVFPNFDANLSERENTSINGWRRVYDCGQSVFIKTI